MGNVILCTGQRTTKPYYLEEYDIHIYCIEELCYVFLQNAYMLDQGIVRQELINWIQKECQLEKLTKRLYPLIREKNSLKIFVSEILNYVGFYEEKTILYIQNAIETSKKLTVYERRKKRIDAMVEKEKYESALYEYNKLLEEIPEGERSLRAKIIHNKGVVYAGLFFFNRAAECFEESYQYVPEEDTYIQFLAAKRMELSEQEYIQFVTNDEHYKLSMDLEHIIEESMRQFQEYPRKNYLMHLKEWRQGEDTFRYYGETEKIVNQLKKDYHYQSSK